MFSTITRKPQRSANSLVMLIVAAAAAAALAPPASAATGIGFDAAHGFSIRNAPSGSLLYCSSGGAFGINSVGVAFPQSMTSPGTALLKVYFTTHLEVWDESARAWANAPVAPKPWYRNLASSGRLYLGLWTNITTNTPLQAWILNFTGVAAGLYRMDLNFFWGFDGHHAVYQTDPCRVG